MVVASLRSWLQRGHVMHASSFSLLTFTTSWVDMAAFSLSINFLRPKFLSRICCRMEGEYWNWDVQNGKESETDLGRLIGGNNLDGIFRVDFDFMRVVFPLNLWEEIYNFILRWVFFFIIYDFGFWTDTERDDWVSVTERIMNDGCDYVNNFFFWWK